MEEKTTQKKTFKEKVKKAAPWIIGTAGAVAVVCGIAYLISASDSHVSNIATVKLTKTVPKVEPEFILPVESADTSVKIGSSYISKPFTVREHQRKLPIGHHPSPAKIAEMQSKGYEIYDNITLIDSYRKNVS